MKILKNDKIKDYSQYDDRWANMSYPRRPYTMQIAGCGPTTCADLIAWKKPDVTPAEIGKWMIKHGYAVAGHGTDWNGMKECLKAYGFKYKDCPTMMDCFLSCEAGHYQGYFLMTSGNRNGTVWTSNGHFIAFSGYKKEGSKHYFWINDPGPRRHDSASCGWYCYEDSMYGMVRLAVTAWPESDKKDKNDKNTDEPKKDAKNAKYKGFDISYVQNGLEKSNFVKAKKAGWDFTIIRLGTVLKGKLYTDAEFESKYKNAKAAGLNIGVYFYSMAKTKADAKKEAAYVLKQLKYRELQYPVYIDIEDKSQSGLSKSSLADICNTFCKTIAAGGYTAGVYASYNWLTNKIGKIDSKYHVWLAQYPKATYKGTYDMHQYTSSGNVTGIGAKIDCNTATLKPKKMKPLTNAEKIAETATKLAYKGKPDDAKYPGGKPTDEYQAALDKNYPDRKSWGVASRKGAACDVFVGTVVRDSGIDKNYPRGLSQQGPYLKKSSDFEEIKNPTVKDLKNGDIIIYEKKSGGGHTCIYVDGKIKEASHEKWYGVTTDTVKSRMDTKNKTWLRVYRAK